jgi:hypothetical protein
VLLLLLPWFGSLSGCHFAPIRRTQAAWDAHLLWGSSSAQREAAWDRWGAEHLESGDIVFVLGESRILLGLVNFSKLSTQIADSPFSHVGLVSREQDQVVVYDIVSEGARRLPLSKFMSDGRIWSVAIKRLRPEFQGYIPAAIEYCRQVIAKKEKFDTDFRLDNDRVYCSEMLELAFRQAGLPLSEPVPMDQLPHFDLLREPTKQLVRAATHIEFDHPVYLPGNDRYGIWSCPYLELVLPPQDAAWPPGADPKANAAAPAVAGLPTEPPGRPKVSTFPGDLRSAVSAGTGPSERRTERGAHR